MKRDMFHWTQEPSLFIDLCFRRELIRGFRAIDQVKAIDGFSILDAACGHGSLTRTLIEFFPVDQINGSDIDSDCIAKCCAMNSSINYFEQDLLNPDAKESEYDLIILTAAMAQFSESEQITVLDNAEKQLKPGGFIMIVDVDSEKTDSLFNRLVLDYEIVYKSGFSKMIVDKWSILPLANRLPLSILRMIDKYCIGSNVLNHYIVRVID